MRLGARSVATEQTAGYREGPGKGRVSTFPSSTVELPGPMGMVAMW